MSKSLNRCGETGCAQFATGRTTRKRPPFPPRREACFSSIPLLTFFTPLAPTCRFPVENRCSPFANREQRRVSLLGSGQIAGQLFRLTPDFHFRETGNSRAALPAKLTADDWLPALQNVMPFSQIRRFANSHRVCGRFRASTLPILPTILITQGESPNFIFTHQRCESANLRICPISRLRHLACVLPGICL